MLELVRHTPESNGEECDDHDEVLDASEGVLYWSNRDDYGAFPRPEGDEEEDPDAEDADNADGDGDEEPLEPVRGRVHVLDRDDVLGTGDRGGHATDVGGQGDAEDERFGEVRVCGEVAEHGL